MSVEHQVAIIYAAINGALDDVPVEKVKDFEDKFHAYLDSTKKNVIELIKKHKELNKETEEALKHAIEEFKKVYAL